MHKAFQAQELSVIQDISALVVPTPAPQPMVLLEISVQQEAIALQEVMFPNLVHLVPIVIQLVPPTIKIAVHVIRVIIA